MGDQQGLSSIDSLKQLSNLFGISIDELISDDDVENKRLLEDAESRRFYWYAIACLIIATVAAVISYFSAFQSLYILSTLGVVGYIICGLLSKPKYKRLSAKKMIVPYIVSRLIILAVILVVIVSAFLKV